MPEVENEYNYREMDDYLDADTPPESLSGSSSTGLTCVVCGDQATGRHYGSPSCNGCKGFFRRTIRRNYSYTCRFNGNCAIDKHNRAVCRACRYMRCVKNGMKIDAVQNERDLIGKRPRGGGPMSVIPPSMMPPPSLQPPPQQSVPCYPSCSQSTIDPLMDSIWDSQKNLLDFLLKAENKIKSLRETVIKETGQYEYSTKNEPAEQASCGKTATVYNILQSLHSQLLLVIEWAKSLRPFADLSPADQTALLKNFASQHIVLCVAYRSINSFNSLKLLNDFEIPRPNRDGAQFPDDCYRRDCERVMDQLVAPMRFMQMDDYEFVAMKACVLFNPVARGLSGESVMKVLQTRRKICAALESYVNAKIPHEPNRIGDLTFFILSPLQIMAKSLSEDVLMTKMSGVARIDHLMEELILEDTDPKDILPPTIVSQMNGQFSRQISETERKLSNPTYSIESMGKNNSGNYDYDMLSTLSNYIMCPEGFNRPLSPLTDPFLTSVVKKVSQKNSIDQSSSISSTSQEDRGFNHSSSVSPITNEQFPPPSSIASSCPNYYQNSQSWHHSGSYDIMANGNHSLSTQIQY